jgi:hypothetical protein
VHLLLALPLVLPMLLSISEMHGGAARRQTRSEETAAVKFTPCGVHIRNGVETTVRVERSRRRCAHLSYCCEKSDFGPYVRNNLSFSLPDASH